LLAQWPYQNTDGIRRIAVLNIASAPLQHTACALFPTGTMSDSTTPATLVTANFAQQTANGPGSFSGATPPLLPAFLITGVLLAAIVFIIVWRHVIERRHLQREDDPTWPIDGSIGGGGGGGGVPKGPPPKLWDLQVMSESERATWAEMMVNCMFNGPYSQVLKCDAIWQPLSATALRATPKARRPRYLVPSDRPISFFSRMFGGDRRAPRAPQPPISVLAPTQPRSASGPPEDSDDEEPINRLEVVVLISLPHPRRVRRPSYLSEKSNESTNLLSSSLDKKSSKGGGDESEAEDTSHKGKKRSLETTISHGYDPRADYGRDDEDGMNEVAFGTMVMPYVEEG
jgi:hypothetical protein